MKLCPTCQHPMTDYWTFDACTFCKYQERKPITVLGKQYDPFDFQSLGDAISAVWTHILHTRLSQETLSYMMTIDRLRDLQLNLAMNKGELAYQFLKEYAPFLEAFKQEYEKMHGKK